MRSVIPSQMSEMSADQAQKLFVCKRQTRRADVLIAEGILDSSTYRPLRDAIIKASLDEPPAVIIDVTSLIVPSESAWAVVTSARWHIGEWPDVPLMLVCAHHAGRDAVTRNGITRYVPVYASLEDALRALADGHDDGVRQRARAELTATALSLARARQLTEEWLTAWSRSDLISVVKLVVTVLVENVLVHTDSAPSLRLESKGDAVTVAVEDNTNASAVRRERSPDGNEDVSGLAIVAAVCRTWGNAPTPTGKAVWAVIGPENRM